MLHNATNTFISTLARLGGRFLAILDPMRDGQCRENPETPRHSGNPTLRTPAPCELRSPIPPDQTKVPLK